MMEMKTTKRFTPLLYSASAYIFRIPSAPAFLLVVLFFLSKKRKMKTERKNKLKRKFFVNSPKLFFFI